MGDLGIDISQHQSGRIDMGAVRGGSRYIGIKQTEGLTWPDQDDPAAAELHRRWRAEARDAAFDVVVLYHYLRPQAGRTGADEADHFIAFVGDLGPNEAVAIDDELDSAPRGEEHEDFVISFVDRIEARYPDRTGKVLYYSYPGYLETVSTDRVVQRCPLWLAAYGTDDGQEHENARRFDRWTPDRCAMWQFTSAGRGFPGVADTDPPSLDVNRCDGLDRLAALVLPAGAPVVALASPVPVSVPLAAFPPRPILRQGAPTSPMVAHLQDLLRQHGVDPGPTDGVFGPGTEDAVAQFQSAAGLVVDGVVGPKTWEALEGGGQPAPAVAADGVNADPAAQIEAWAYEDGVAGFQRSFAWFDIAVDGQVGPETARAVQAVVDNGGKLSEHFHMDEFRSHGNGRLRIDRAVIRSCEATRAALGAPLGILSAYRDPAHNAAVGGADDSQHVKGTAVDPSPYLPRAALGSAGWTGIGVSARVSPGAISHMDRRDLVGAGPAEFSDN